MKRLVTFLSLSLASIGPLLAQDPAIAQVAAPVPAVVKNVTSDAAEKLVAEGKVLVLDVRTPEEFAAGHIAGAVNLNMHEDDFAKKLALIGQGKPVIVHCAAGGRSAQCLPEIQRQKFSAIYHLNGGFHEWKSAGKPIVKSPAP